jgi:hypothetical protein
MTREVCPAAYGDGKPVEEADSGYENEKIVAAKMNILEENLGIKKRGKKAVGTFDLSVPVKTKDHEKVAWNWINRIQTHYLLFWVSCGFLI